MSYDTDRYRLVKLSGQSLAVVECGIQICHPGHAAPPITYPHYSIHFILEGKGTFIKDGNSYEVCAGQGFLITPNTTCVYIADQQSPWKYVYATFRGTDDDTLVHNAGLDENNIFFDFPLDNAMRRDIYAMHQAGKKNEARGYDVTGYFLLVMSRLIKNAMAAAAGGRSAHYVQCARRFMEDRFRERITGEDVAAHIRVERSYLYRLFLKHEGISPSDYLKNVRLNAAAKMLENQEISIKEIAESTGFCNISHFYKNFTKKYGISPKTYRTKNKERTNEWNTY